jgi:hypothetical protein
VDIRSLVIGSDRRPLERSRGQPLGDSGMLTAQPDCVDASPSAVRPQWTDSQFVSPAGGHDGRMTIGTSLFLIALGAILKFAVTAHVAGVDLHVVGVILIIVGLAGLVLGLGMWISARDPWRRGGAPPPPPDAY